MTLVSLKMLTFFTKIKSVNRISQETDEMMSDHDEWIAKAVELARVKRYDQARELALQVVREDARNTKALWIVANVTNSLTERRNALKALLRLQPDNLYAQKMLASTDQEFKTTVSTRSTSAVRSIKPDTLAQQRMILYTAAAIAVLVIITAAFVAAAL
jgi:hypothetical protein